MNARKAYVLLFTVTAATVFVEIILTRIFSVVLWYHFAFAAISLAMLGMAGGAMYIYLHRHRYPPDDSLAAMGRLSAYFAASLVVSYLLSLGVAFTMDFHPVAVISLLLIVGLWGIPFFLSGMIVALALTRTPFPVGRLYAADLVGAALGCLLVQPALTLLGPPAALGAAALALVLAAQWAWPPRRSWGTMVGVGGLAVFVVVCLTAPRLFSPRWVKGMWEPPAEKVFWNAYSRVAVFPPELRDPGFGGVGLLGWGMGDKLPAEGFPKVYTRYENVDANSATWITQFDGDLSKHGYLAYDVVNAAYHLRPQGEVAIVGVGGGRDVLCALMMGGRKVTGIELNSVFIQLLQEDYAEFSGRIAHHPRVHLVAAEARNWLERTRERFDLIQISLIDTWAATASGAYALSENTIYTIEGWSTFLSRLKPGGILSVSRWYRPTAPEEAYRLTALAQEALTASGQKEPQRCVAVVANLRQSSSIMPGIATVLVSPNPLSGEECQKIEDVAQKCGFAVLYSPSHPTQPFLTLLNPAGSRQWQQSYGFDISSPTDNRPFFFFIVRPGDLFKFWNWHTIWDTAQASGHTFNYVAILILGLLGLALVTAAAAITILPLYLREGRQVWQAGDGVPAVYFAAIGLAFMLVEIAVMQRTGIILGHPVYGLVVTLFSLLLGSGVGSLLSSELPGRPRTKARVFLLGAVGATLIAILILPAFAGLLRAAPQPVRMVAVASFVFAVGLFMGTPFPMGLEAARARGREDLLPWFWGVNGVCSVLGAFLATVFSIFTGAMITGLMGVLGYMAACLALWGYSRALPAD